MKTTENYNGLLAFFGVRSSRSIASLLFLAPDIDKSSLFLSIYFCSKTSFIQRIYFVGHSFPNWYRIRICVSVYIYTVCIIYYNAPFSTQNITVYFLIDMAKNIPRSCKKNYINKSIYNTSFAAPF